VNIKHAVLVGIFVWGVHLQAMNPLVEKELGTQLPTVLKKLGCSTMEQALGVLETYQAFRNVRQKLQQQLDKHADIQAALEDVVKNIVKTADMYEKGRTQEKADVIVMAGGITVRAMVDKIVRSVQGKDAVLSRFAERAMPVMYITPDLGYYDRENSILSDTYEKYDKELSGEDKETAFEVILENFEKLKKNKRYLIAQNIKRYARTFTLVAFCVD
jgi:hypothetical protein